MTVTRPKTCVLEYRDGRYVGCGRCDECHDGITSQIESDASEGYITEAEAIERHAANDALYGVVPFSTRHGLAPYYQEEHRP
ncbi:hypothetical protein ACWC9H_35470 [Streptomyces sp. NPDC001251]